MELFTKNLLTVDECPAVGFPDIGQKGIHRLSVTLCPRSF